MNESNKEKNLNINETEALSEEQQAELLKKYDAESNTREMKGITGTIVFILLLSFSIFQLYTGAFGQYTAYIQRTVHLGFALTLIFMLYPARKSKVHTHNKVPWYDVILVLLAIMVSAYWPIFFRSG